MTKQESRDYWLAKFNAKMAPEHKLTPFGIAIFEGAFEIGWEAAENEMRLILGAGCELDEFGRTDEELEHQVNDLREERSV